MENTLYEYKAITPNILEGLDSDKQYSIIWWNDSKSMVYGSYLLNDTENALESIRSILLPVTLKEQRSEENEVWKILTELLAQELTKSDACTKILSLSQFKTSTKEEGWISVEDRLPELGQRVVALDNIEKYPFIAFIFGSKQKVITDNKLCDWLDNGRGFSVYPTHWMPLPKSPVEKGDTKC